MVGILCFFWSKQPEGAQKYYSLSEKDWKNLSFMKDGLEFSPIYSRSGMPAREGCHACAKIMRSETGDWLVVYRYARRLINNLLFAGIIPGIIILEVKEL